MAYIIELVRIGHLLDPQGKLESIDTRPEQHISNDIYMKQQRQLA